MSRKVAWFWFVLLSFGLAILVYLNFGDGIRIQIGQGQSIASTTQKTGYDFKNITGDLYFTPGYKIDDYLINFDDIHGDLDVYMYAFTYDKIIKKFENLAKKGVNIRMILESSKYKENSSEFLKIQKKLGNYGSKVIDDSQMGTTYVHAKTIVTDDRFIIQSANFAYSSFYKNIETYFVGHDPEIIASLKKIFNKDFQGEKLSSQDIADNLLVCNIDCRDKIESVLKNAKQKIRIDAQYLEDERIISILRGMSGLDLKMMFGDNQNLSKLSGFDGKYKIMKKYYDHNKTILVDDRILIVGSMNLSANSLDNNREIGIVLLDDNMIKRYNQRFDRDYDSIR